jgi:hypothetical protein
MPAISELKLLTDYSWARDLLVEKFRANIHDYLTAPNVKKRVRYKARLGDDLYEAMLSTIDRHQYLSMMTLWSVGQGIGVRVRHWIEEAVLDEMGRAQAGTRFNVFRRFREAVLQRSEARQILIDYWMGHSNPSMADRYGRQLVEDVEYRQDQAKKVGLGFDLPPSLFGLRGLQTLGNGRNKEAA